MGDFQERSAPWVVSGDRLVNHPAFEQRQQPAQVVGVVVASDYSAISDCRYDSKPAHGITSQFMESAGRCAGGSAMYHTAASRKYILLTRSVDPWSLTMEPDTAAVSFRLASFAMTASEIQLRPVTLSDLPIFFVQQSDAAANWSVAFTMHDPANWDAFQAKWQKIIDDERITARTITWQGAVAGNIVCFTAPYSGNREIGYWLGRQYWNRGIATQAVLQFVSLIEERPLYAAVAADNAASLRVLEKCGFTRCAANRAFANARGQEIDEVILQLVGQSGVDLTATSITDVNSGIRQDR
jgi:RimJ/RimL family protein N-acetyltransferase